MDEKIARIQERVRANSAAALRQWLDEAEPPRDGNMKGRAFDVDPRATLGVGRATADPIAVEYRERAVKESAAEEPAVAEGCAGEEPTAVREAQEDESAGADVPVLEEEV